MYDMVADIERGYRPPEKESSSLVPKVIPVSEYELKFPEEHRRLLKILERNPQQSARLAPQDPETVPTDQRLRETIKDHSIFTFQNTTDTFISVGDPNSPTSPEITAKINYGGTHGSPYIGWSAEYPDEERRSGTLSTAYFPYIVINHEHDPEDKDFWIIVNSPREEDSFIIGPSTMLIDTEKSIFFPKPPTDQKSQVNTREIETTNINQELTAEKPPEAQETLPPITLSLPIRFYGKFPSTHRGATDFSSHTSPQLSRFLMPLSDKRERYPYEDLIVNQGVNLPANHSARLPNYLSNRRFLNQELIITSRGALLVSSAFFTEADIQFSRGEKVTSSRLSPSIETLAIDTKTLKELIEKGYPVYTSIFPAHPIFLYYEGNERPTVYQNPTLTKPKKRKLETGLLESVEIDPEDGILWKDARGFLDTDYSDHIAAAYIMLQSGEQVILPNVFNGMLLSHMDKIMIAQSLAHMMGKIVEFETGTREHDQGISFHPKATMPKVNTEQLRKVKTAMEEAFSLDWPEAYHTWQLLSQSF